MKVKFFIVRYMYPPHKEDTQNLIEWAAGHELVGGDDINEFIKDKKIVDIKLSCFADKSITVCVMYEEE